MICSESMPSSLSASAALPVVVKKAVESLPSILSASPALAMMLLGRKPVLPVATNFLALFALVVDEPTACRPSTLSEFATMVAATAGTEDTTEAAAITTITVRRLRFEVLINVSP
jgi:hypothetical protein